MREEFIREYLEELYKLGYRYLVTDEDLTDWVFESEPEKRSFTWCDYTDNNESCLPFSLGLTSWEDEDPKSIAEILGLHEVDWSRVAVDTKILVSIDGRIWSKEHFAKYENGKVYAWHMGLTSWTSNNSYCYKYAKLAEE